MIFPFLISLPHCSSYIPDEIKKNFALNENQITQSEDFGTKEVFGKLSPHVVSAQYSRLLVDLNRDPDNRSEKGIIAKTDYFGQEIYKQNKYPDKKQTDKIIEKYYIPYHNNLEAAFEKSGIKMLFDCHSLNSTGPIDAPDKGEKRKDFILSNNGDKNGNAVPGRGRVCCPKEILFFIKSLFETSGFSVSINKPYSGGFITVNYGQKYFQQKKYAIQIEMNHGLIIKPENKEIDFELIRDIKKRVEKIFIEIKTFLT